MSKLKAILAVLQQAADDSAVNIMTGLGLPMDKESLAIRQRNVDSSIALLPRAQKVTMDDIPYGDIVKGETIRSIGNGKLVAVKDPLKLNVMIGLGVSDKYKLIYKDFNDSINTLKRDSMSTCKRELKKHGYMSEEFLEAALNSVHQPLVGGEWVNQKEDENGNLTGGRLINRVRVVGTLRALRETFRGEIKVWKEIEESIIAEIKSKNFSRNVLTRVIEEFDTEDPQE